MGQAQYLAERYDLRGARILCVSSGAVAAATIKAMEAADTPETLADAAEARRRGQEVFAALDEKLRAITRHPAAYLGRLDALIRDLMEEILADGQDFGGDRVVVCVEINV